MKAYGQAIGVRALVAMLQKGRTGLRFRLLSTLNCFFTATQQEAREAPEAMTTIVDVDAYLRPFAPAIAVFNGLGEASCIARVAPVEQWVMNTAESTGIPHDQLRNVLCLFLVFPIGLIFQSIKSPTVKHLFSLVTGMAFAQFAFGSDWMHTVLTSVVVYLVLVLGSISKAIAKQQHIIIFTFLLTYLSATHIYRTLTDYMGWSLDITGPLMLMTIKLSALGFNVFDGTVDRAVLVKQADAEAQKQKAGQRFQRTPADRLQRSVSTVPSPLEYFGYVFCFCSYVAGPAFEITEYLNSIDGSKYKSTDGVAPGGRIGHALKKLAWGILFIALLKAVGDVYFPMTGTYSKAIAEDSPFWYRIVYAWVALFFVRCKYYFGWLVAEGGAVMSGFGYDPKKKDWSGASNMDVWAFEWAPNIDMGARAWNKVRSPAAMRKHHDNRCPVIATLAFTEILAKRSAESNRACLCVLAPFFCTVHAIVVGALRVQAHPACL